MAASISIARYELNVMYFTCFHGQNKLSGIRWEWHERVQLMIYAICHKAKNEMHNVL